jgi:predicted alpha/beta hydrolase family esterase
MKRVFIIHRWGATPKSDWYPWLKEQLEKDGYEVHVPAMPDTEIPVIEKWIGCLSDAVGTPDNETYFVGHSIGCQTILRYLDSHMFEPLETVGGAVFVAGWFNLENLESDEEKNIAAPWIERPVNP